MTSAVHVVIAAKALGARRILSIPILSVIAALLFFCLYSPASPYGRLIRKPEGSGEAPRFLPAWVALAKTARRIRCIPIPSIFFSFCLDIPFLLPSIL
uniref:Secreted protein n=1 Tax=Steinernema glaseri TaxID=37863 RepID=A0A1I7ZFX9_9BILA